MKYKNVKRRNPLYPFNVHSIIGYNWKVPILNLTSVEEYPEVAYASGHIVTILNCNNNEQEYVLGHELDVQSILRNEGCNLLVSADKYLINVWERHGEVNRNIPTSLLKTINDPLNGESILSIGLSVDGEYLVLASHKYIQLWALKNGADIPDTIRELPDHFRKGSKIVFCKNKSQSNSFAVRTEKNLLFCRWNVEKKFLETHSPAQFPGVRNIKDSSYCTNYCKGVSIASQGTVIVWSDTPPSKEFKHHLFVNRMEFQFKLKLGFYQLKTVSCCQGLIIISDSKGEVKFYDDNMKYCFSYDLLGQKIHSISFSNRTVDEDTDCETNCKLEQNTWHKNLNGIGPFFVSCENGRIFKCKLNSMPDLISDSDPSFMTCFDVHPKKDLLCGGRQGGQIFLYDYSKNKYEKILSLPLELTKHLKKLKLENVNASCLAFSSCGRYLAAGMNNGHISVFNTITFKLSQKPILVAADDVLIEKIIFSNSNEFIVYLDSYCTVGLLYFQSSWVLLQKSRIHDTPIVYMAFRETDDEFGLVTISEDYSMANYTIQNLKSATAVGLFMKKCYRVDFLSALKSCITLKKNILAFPNVHTENDFAFLTTDHNFKFQVRNFESFEVIHTFAAPISENEPITLMNHIFLNNENAIVFSNKNIIGLHHLPIDGNPNKYLPMVGHSRNILHMKVSNCNKYLITIGEDDPTVYIWKIKMSALIKQYSDGGTSLRPFCKLIPDGVSGQLFTEMQDLFFYIQIKSQKDGSSESQHFKLIDGISVADAIDFMRGIGFFPHEAKVEYIMEEMKYYTNDSSMITFENLLKLFVNYKPPFGYLKADIHQTLKYLGYSYTMQSADTEITRERLVEICTELGEQMDEKESATYLTRLDGQFEDSESSDGSTTDLFNKIRSVYTINEFMKYILGVE